MLAVEEGEDMAVRHRCLGGGGLMFAGLIVMLVGLAVVVMRTLEAPSYWTPLVVGAVLFLVGAARRATRDRNESPPASSA
jgi:ribose/xylose/arabinose/galactoside ABC-type transport system permease subunit